MNQDEIFNIKIWGGRGSYPAAGLDMSRYGGNTACIEISVGGNTIILDAGTGIISLGKDLLKRSLEHDSPVDVTLLFSHLHHDHTQGFPFFAPAFVPTSQIQIFGPDFFNSTPESSLSTLMAPPFFPISLSDLNAKITYRVIRESDVILIGKGAGGVTSMRAVDASSFADPFLTRVRVLRSYAHPGGVLHYRIDYNGRSVVYATDTEGYVNGDQRLVRFARGADLLVHDAQYTDDHYVGQTSGSMITQGFGHSTTSMACQVAAAAGVKKLILFHHAPEYNDERLDQVDSLAKQMFTQSEVAHEGLVVEVFQPARLYSNLDHCITPSTLPVDSPY
jgi:phosphoribosyl 1,2-cyclic phosphodiesterase